MSISRDITAKKEIERATRYSQKLSFIMIDMDHFKDVNDTYGHQVGDDVLIVTAKLISEHVRNVDIVGRYGGEEFVVICPNIGLEEVEIVAEKLRAETQKHNFDKVGSKTISLGVAEFIRGDTPDDLVKKADTALYKAKEEGRNRVVKYEV